MLIKENNIVTDEWTVLRLHGGEAADRIAVPAGKVIVPLPVWNCQYEALQGRTELGLWLAGLDRAEDIPDAVHRFPVIAIDFHKYNDGRGYTLAYRLRKQMGYRGELRAMGDVLHDQLFYLKRVGFDAFDVRENKDAHAALAGFNDFSLTYQASVDNDAPLFKRTTRGVAA